MSAKTAGFTFRWVGQHEHRWESVAGWNGTSRCGECGTLRFDWPDGEHVEIGLRGVGQVVLATNAVKHRDEAMRLAAEVAQQIGTPSRIEAYPDEAGA